MRHQIHQKVDFGMSVWIISKVHLSAYYFKMYVGKCWQKLYHEENDLFWFILFELITLINIEIIPFFM